MIYFSSKWLEVADRSVPFPVGFFGLDFTANILRAFKMTAFCLVVGGATGDLRSLTLCWLLPRIRSVTVGLGACQGLMWPTAHGALV